MPDKDFVRRNLKKLIEVRGASPYQLSVDMGHARTFIHDFLIGRKQKLGGNSVFEISKRLNADVATYFFADNEVPDDPNQIVPFSATANLSSQSGPVDAEEQKLLEELTRIPPPSPLPDSDVDLADAKDLPKRPLFGGPRNVPVLGTAVGGSDQDGDFRFNGDTIDYVPRPAAIAMRKDVYAVYLQNTSMHPRYKDGACLYIDPHRKPSVDDEALIELYPEEEGENGRGYIKTIVRRTSTQLIVSQYNPSKEITFDAKRVKTLHRVIPYEELLGI